MNSNNNSNNNNNSNKLELDDIFHRNNRSEFPDIFINNCSGNAGIFLDFIRRNGRVIFSAQMELLQAALDLKNINFMENIVKYHEPLLGLLFTFESENDFKDGSVFECK